MSEPARGGNLADIAPEAVVQAREAIRPFVVRTPLVEAPRLPGLNDASVYLKLENLQRTGSFKVRGATNRILKLSTAETERGMVAASGGNHALGVAWAARARGIAATVVMPIHASPLKVRRAGELGASVVQSGVDYAEAHEEAVRRSQRDGLVMIEPFDDPEIIAGQGTIGLEIVEELPSLRRIVAGVGGGGLLAGIAIGARSRQPDVDLVGVQPEGADTLRKSLLEGRIVTGDRPNTIADGLATRRIGELPYRVFGSLGVRAFAVSDREIARAGIALFEEAKLVVEPAGAAALAALTRYPELQRGGPTVLVVSGGNMDLSLLDKLRRLAELPDGRRSP